MSAAIIYFCFKTYLQSISVAELVYKLSYPVEIRIHSLMITRKMRGPFDNAISTQFFRDSLLRELVLSLEV